MNLKSYFDTSTWRDSAPLIPAMRVVIWAQVGFRLSIWVVALVAYGVTNARSERAQTARDVEALTASLDFLSRAAMVTSVLGIGIAASLAIGVVLAAIWTFRVVTNARLLNPAMGYGPWGAVLWHTVPVANLIFPHSALVAAWRSSALLSAQSAQWWRVSLWWVLLWLSIALPLLPGQLFEPLSLYSEAGSMSLMYAGPGITAGLTLLAGLAFLSMARKLSAMQAAVRTVRTFEAG